MIVRLAAQLLKTIAKLRSQVREPWISVEVVHLIRISFEIVKLISILSEIFDVLVSLGAHAATRWNIFVRRVFVVLVEPVLTPLDVLTFNQRHQALALKTARRRHSGEIQERRRNVEIEDHLFRGSSRFNSTRI